jgi:hypothetical protein
LTPISSSKQSHITFSIYKVGGDIEVNRHNLAVKQTSNATWL